MDALSLLIDFHLDGERQGPGSPETTRKALSLIPIRNQKGLKIADIGCGTGSQTLTLAKELDAKIIAVDLFPAFLEKLDKQAEQMGLAEKIETRGISMDQLDFERESLDVIWSEGAIYNIGFEEGLKSWRPFLKAGGYLAVSEITWLTASPPDDLASHWNREYPQIAPASRKFEQLEQQGFSPVGYIVLDEEAWLKHYYEPSEARFDAFLKRHGSSEKASAIIESEKIEIELYRKYKAYFSYGFYIAQKI